MTTWTALCRSSFGNCTSLRHAVAAGCEAVVVAESRFLRGLHFIEAAAHQERGTLSPGRSFFGTSLRLDATGAERQQAPLLQFLRELHFIEAGR